MSQAENYVKLCIKGWTSHFKASQNGCGSYPWRRWIEWASANWIERDYGPEGIGESRYLYRGKFYREETRKVRRNGVEFMQRRLVRV